MATEKLDPRVALAKMEAEETAARAALAKKAMSTNIFAPDWSKDIHNELQMALVK